MSDLSVSTVIVSYMSRMHGVGWSPLARIRAFWVTRGRLIRLARSRWTNAPWDSPEVAAEVVDIAGPGAKLVRYEGAERFDVLPLLVATDGAIAAFGHDGRRLRPNIVIGGVEGLTEREWPGACLRIGKVLIGVQDLRLRCIMTSFDPDTLIQDKDITRGIYRRFEGKLALNCFVIEGRRDRRWRRRANGTRACLHPVRRRPRVLMAGC